MKTLTIIQQNDTHGYLQSHPEIFWSNSHTVREVGGFSKVYHYIKEIKKTHKNVLFIDGGDLFHGTAPLVLTKGQIIKPLLRVMELDAFVPGNWDFAYGKEQLMDLLRGLPFPALACNLKDDRNNFILNPYVIKHINNIKVGMIGSTYPYVDETMPDNFSKGLKFSISLDEIQNRVNILKEEKVDLIILISHMGLTIDYKVASMIEGINIILSGHTHDRVLNPIKQKETIIIQSGSSSSFLGQLQVTCNQGKIVDYKHQLVALTSKTCKQDPNIDDLVERIMNPFKEMDGDIIGKTDVLLHRMTLNESPMDKLITEAYLHFFDGDAAFSHAWRYGAPITPGNITLKQLYDIIPTNPEIFELEVEGLDLFKSLENNLEQVFSSDPFNQKGGYVLRSSGLKMAYKPYNPKGNRIQYLEINGRRYSPSKTYRIIGAGDQLFKNFNSQKQYKKIHSIDVIKNYLSEIKIFKNKDSNQIIPI